MGVLDAARSRFMRAHTVEVYAALTDDRRTAIRAEELVYAAAERFPGLVPTRADVARERELALPDKEGIEIAQGLMGLGREADLKDVLADVAEDGEPGQAPSPRIGDQEYPRPERSDRPTDLRQQVHRQTFVRGAGWSFTIEAAKARQVYNGPPPARFALAPTRSEIRRSSATARYPVAPKVASPEPRLIAVYVRPA